MIFVRASSTASVTALHSSGANPNDSVKRSTAPRTAQSKLGSLGSSRRISTPRPRSPLGSFVSGGCDGGEVFINDLGSPLHPVWSNALNLSTKFGGPLQSQPLGGLCHNALRARSIGKKTNTFRGPLPATTEN